MSESSKKYEVIQASPKALALCDADYIGKGERTNDEENAKYPFRSLLVGESFAVPFSETNPGTLQSLRTSATQYSKKLVRKFRVFVHTEYAYIEVARIA